MDGVMNIDELQDRLDGVYDLNQVDDCRKMIEILLRSVREKTALEKQCRDNLKMLALMVINGNPEARELAKEAMAGSGKSKKDVVDFLKQMALRIKEADDMTNHQLIQDVIDSVWSGLSLNSHESAVLGEMISRTKKFLEE